MCGSRQVVWLLGHVCWQVGGPTRPFFYGMWPGQLNFLMLAGMWPGQLNFLMLAGMWPGQMNFNVGRHVAWPVEF